MDIILILYENVSHFLFNITAFCEWLITPITIGFTIPVLNKYVGVPEFIPLAVIFGSAFLVLLVFILIKKIVPLL